MSVIINHNGELFRPFSYDKEAEFEAAVVRLAEQIFGPSTIYVDVKKRIRGNDVISIPDGYLIDMTDANDPKLFIVENEIVSHDPFKHIGIQLLKFATSFDDAKTDIRNFLMEEISRDENQLKKLEQYCHDSSSRNIDNYLDKAVYGGFRAIVIIDEARTELHKVLEKINANISVLELKTYQTERGLLLHQFDTLYDEFDEDDISDRLTRTKESPTSTVEERTARRARRAIADTVIVPAREDGFKRVFLGEDQWYAIRIGAAMKEKIKYIAAYQVAPISAVTHIAEVQDIKPYMDTGKYLLKFKGSATEIKPIGLRESKNKPQGPVYVTREKLLKASHLEDAFV